MDTTSPPLTPIRQYMSPIEVSPANSYREHLRRRTSSFSSNHDRSPTTPRNRNRFSNASQYSNDLPSPGAGGGDGGGGMGNLADELGDLNVDEEYEEGVTEETMDEHRDMEQGVSMAEGSRDSGIDVSYASKRSSPNAKTPSKPFGSLDKPPDEREETQEDELSPDLEDALNTVARMASTASAAEDPLVPRTIALLQDLGHQASLEASTQRLTTSTNSLTSHLLAQTKSLQALSTSVFSPFAFAGAIDFDTATATAPLVDALLRELPLPDPAPLQGLQKLERETANVIQTLSQLTDTLQMGKQATNAAARHLRTTQATVATLRRERERAELARHALARDESDARAPVRRCAAECHDVLSGFEDFCEALREGLTQDVAAGVGPA